MSKKAVRIDRVPFTPLYRAVDSTELASIVSNKRFSKSPNGTEFKGFFFTKQDAEAFALQEEATGRSTMAVVTAKAPTALVDKSPIHSAATEGPGVLIPNGNLHQVEPNL